MKKWKGWLIGALCVTASAFTLFGCDGGKESDTPDNHEHSYVSAVTAATCTEGGYTTYTCECGDSYIAEETAAFGHTFDNDCTTADKCANCDTTASANGTHIFDNDCTTDDKCKDCDTTASANGEHEFDNDCTTADKCANCDTTASANAEHEFDNDCTTDDKCANCDTTASANGAHTFDNDCTTADKCANCETTASANAEHIFDNDCTTADKCKDCETTASANAEHAYVSGVCNVCGTYQPTEGIKYTLVNDGTAAAVTGMTCAEDDIVLAKTYEGVPVVEIAENAFSGVSFITSIRIPEGITKIGTYAFYRCSDLETVYLPSTMKTLDDSAFCGLSQSIDVYYAGTIDDWVSIEFGDSMANPLSGSGENTLYIDNKAVTKVNVTTATKISAYAFKSYAKLTSLTIGDSVQTIGEMAFYDCNYLTEVVMGSGVQSIGQNQFYSLINIMLLYYNGTASEWNEIEIASNSSYLLNSQKTWIYYYSEEEPTDSGKYWHYVDGKVKIWS